MPALYEIRLLYDRKNVGAAVREVREKVGADRCGCPITGRLQQTASTLMGTLLTDMVGMMIANEWHELVQVTGVAAQSQGVYNKPHRRLWIRF
ncbi:hypothetical protein L6R29_12935 [Myxococcota bacterium]|nr:hypothetical protein [Myxococcota bacterium]